jgi:hypothetical protein
MPLEQPVISTVRAGGVMAWSVAAAPVRWRRAR